MAIFSIDEGVGFLLGQVAWEAARDRFGTEAEQATTWEMLSRTDKIWWAAGACKMWSIGFRMALKENK
jgi:hypothetical protein